MTTTYRISRSTPESNIGLAVFGIVAVVLFTLPWWDSDGSLRTPLVLVLIYLSLAQMWNLLAGFAGLISIGQQMFVGVGVYSLLQFSEEWGLDPFLAVAVAGVVAAELLDRSRPVPIDLGAQREFTPRSGIRRAARVVWRSPAAAGLPERRRPS